MDTAGAVSVGESGEAAAAAATAATTPSAGRPQLLAPEIKINPPSQQTSPTESRKNSGVN